MIDLDTELVVSDEVLFRELEEEAVLLDLKSGRYYGLDTVGRRIWVLLGELGTPRLVMARMEEEYEVDSERLRRDLLELIAKLASNGLLRPASDRPAPPVAGD